MSENTCMDADNPNLLTGASVCSRVTPKCCECGTPAIYFADPRTAKPSRLPEHSWCRWHWEHALTMVARTALDESEDQQRTGRKKTTGIIHEMKTRYKHGGN